MEAKDEQELRLKARNAISSNTLLRRRPDRTFGGPGGGGACPVCGATLGTNDMVFDVEFDTAGGRQVNWQMHVRCFAAWELELDPGDDQDNLRLDDAEHTLQGSERDSTDSERRE
jgi:hypothetical protein